MQWIADQLGFFPEQQTCIRRHRCTADSIADVVATLEDVKSCGDVAMLLLVDAQSAFDGLPHVVAALDTVNSFLGGIGLNVSATKTEALLIHSLAAARVHVKQLRAATTKVRRVQGAIGKLQQRGRGCSLKWALRLNQAAASSVMLYALPLVNLTPAGWNAQRSREGHPGAPQVLSCCSYACGGGRVAPEATHIDCLHHAADGAALLERLCSLPGSRMGGLVPLYHQMVPDPPAPVASPPPHHRPPEQAATCKLQEQLEGRLQVFTDGPMMPGGTVAASYVVPAWTSSRQCKVPFPASSAAAELAGLQILANHRGTGLTGSLLAAKYRALAASGTSVSFHWLPSHVGIAGSTPAWHSHLKARLKKLLVTVHPDSRVANGRGPRLLPETGLSRRDRSALLRLQTGCVWTAACRHAKGRCASPACSRCGDPETLEHLLCDCPALAQERSRVTTAYRRQDLPAFTLEQCSSRPVPTCQHSGAWWSSWTKRE
ncbi:hypothetical protein HPB52_011974 [Rhipicephalus sanguineus]|uniref:Tick transposon n=1 Tax=Rhipicephalus sanguineus TaxID=34632 RepID=A0A9D4QAT1_RHISA|nr:hypothetical protein HPB52_011974 [Rhipicephalus sanguineus]